MKFIRTIYDWMGSKVHSPWADAWLMLLFFIESSFFIIPVDPLLILYCVHNARKSFYYASIAVMASVLGGAFGYFIGAVLWESVGSTLVKWVISEQTFNDAVAKYKLYQVWAVFIAAFTPVPYKAITISAGFCKLDFLPFIFYSILGRGMRFFMVAGAIWQWGPQIQSFIDRYFNYLVVIFMLIVGASVWALK